jgi:DNA-binding beta-propeller fold protein YncE
VYVWNSTRSNLTSIYAINGTENKVTDIIQVPIGELADLVFDPKTNKGYAVSSINSKVVVIDGNNNKIKNYINVETSKNRVRSLSVNPNTNEIYILNTTSTNQKGGSDRTTISVIDSFTDTVVDLVKLDKGYDIIVANSTSLNKITKTTEPKSLASQTKTTEATANISKG